MTNESEHVAERRDSVEVSRTSATIFTTVVAGGLLAIGSFLLSLSGDIRGISENSRRIDHVEKWANQHDKDARGWIYRIIGCENKVERCQERYRNLKDE